ncbi:MAG: 3-dehydroquinate synthase [Bacteroidetes bacterium]|nr:3-dehydroquinate synthase [Bacteroidota bacterium]
MRESKTIITSDFTAELTQLLNKWQDNKIFILTDDHAEKFCLPTVLECANARNSQIITIEHGDSHKTIESAIKIWSFLSEHGANRKSLMINLGGGMITDIGGFTASTFKRGMSYINIPTTLLGAVDAATGGKTGINFLGLKNEIGVFSPADTVLVNVDFFRTLDARNFRSGYAEMVKHALIDSPVAWNKVLSFDFENVDFDNLKKLLADNIAIKQRIVEEDPTEQGIRKALNLGHTFGHAFETLSHKTEKPLLHGYAVAYGLVCELYLSYMKLGFPKDDLLKYRYFVLENYGSFSCDCTDYDAVLELMMHDKKNDNNEINFTLLSGAGEIRINQTATREEIFECLDILFN